MEPVVEAGVLLQGWPLHVWASVLSYLRSGWCPVMLLVSRACRSSFSHNLDSHFPYLLWHHNPPGFGALLMFLFGEGALFLCCSLNFAVGWMAPCHLEPFFTFISASVHWILRPSQSPPQKASADLESLPHHFQWVANSSLLSNFSLDFTSFRNLSGNPKKVWAPRVVTLPTLLKTLITIVLCCLLTHIFTPKL